MQLSSTKEQILQNSFLNQVDKTELENFWNDLKLSDSDEAAQYLSVSISIPVVDVLAVLEQSNSNDGFQYYWEKPNDDISFVAIGTLERIIAKGDNRFKLSSSRGKELLSRVHHFSGVKHSNAAVHLFGGFSFFDDKPTQNWEPYNSASFTLPIWMIIREGEFCVLTFSIPVNEFTTFEDAFSQLLNKLGEIEHVCQAEQYRVAPETKLKVEVEVPAFGSKEHENWINSIDIAKSKIQSGEFEKVVLARELTFKLNREISATHILNRLRFQYPDCYSFLIRQNSDSSFIGSTPERLASFNSQFVLTEGLAGSTSRGKTASEDAVLEYELLHSKKDIKEHEIVRDAIEENLQVYSNKISHPTSPKIKKLSNVQHLFTPITAIIKDGASKTEVLKTLHPTPAVGGFPREEAVSFIKNIENFDRGWYAAPIGWINASGNGEFIVAIRSGLIKNNEVRFFAGCGIVEDSDPEKEWEETNLKFIPMISALEYAGT